MEQAPATTSEAASETTASDETDAPTSEAVETQGAASEANAGETADIEAPVTVSVVRDEADQSTLLVAQATEEAPFASESVESREDAERRATGNGSGRRSCRPGARRSSSP